MTDTTATAWLCEKIMSQRGWPRVVWRLDKKVTLPDGSEMLVDLAYENGNFLYRYGLRYGTWASEDARLMATLCLSCGIEPHYSSAKPAPASWETL